MKNGHQNQELARLFFAEWRKINERKEWETSVKIMAYAKLMELLFMEATKAEKIQFTTFFARMSFVFQKSTVKKRTQYWAHFFRRKIRSRYPDLELDNVLTLGERVSADLIAELFEEPIPEELNLQLPQTIPFDYAEIQIKGFRKNVKVVALKDLSEKERLLGKDVENPTQLIEIQYNIADRNSGFNSTIRQIRSTFGFPVTLNLIDVEIDTEGVYRPKSFVVEPDHLMDVTAVANCFQGSNTEPVVYLLNKFLPFESSIPLIVGNIANFFLDELMRNPSASFRETFPKVFHTNPLTFSLLPDTSIRQIAQSCQRHWVTLQDMVSRGMKKFDIDPAECYLEPSFYDEVNGLQGRLDVFFKNEKRSAIIELKSGKPFMPNQHGIGASHFVQTLLYDLIVRSIYGDEIEPANYILYSKLETNPLKYAPPVKSQQQEALQVRNQLVAIERHLASINGSESSCPIFDKISVKRFPHLKGYLKRNIERFERTYAQLDEIEKLYFNAFAGFIAREHQLSKTGIQGNERINGLASIWLDSSVEKAANFRILKSLKIKENHGAGEEPLIEFERTKMTDPLANFRVGDIAVLYPSRVLERGAESKDDSIFKSPLKSQIFKVTITELTDEKVIVRLRYQQFNLSIFSENEWWNLEPDMMDMGFNAQYKGLFQWAEQPEEKRSLLLTKRPPEQPLPVELSGFRQLPSHLIDEQKRILEKMLSAQEYFLLWGPPGTGKTSQMLKSYAKWIFENTEEDLLLLAYTNRAVDEICEALGSINEEVNENYIRIGSRYSTDKSFHSSLLTNKIAGVNKRSQLIEILNKHRIYVSTLASLSNNQELLSLKKFRRVVIDEASQILEPALVGLLPKFEQFILIGDHKQLPAVVVQDEDKSQVGHPKLHELGIKNLRNSLFERLYLRCQKMGWDWAYDQLSHQGRMHEDIMTFPSVYFYESKLKTLPDNLLPKQSAPLYTQPTNLENTNTQIIENQRIAFVDTPIDDEAPNRKTNQFEALEIAKLVQFFKSNFDQSIGIITPYRAQIALIKKTLLTSNINCDSITIDTVERYQGGARDIILISLCTNSISQLETLVSLSEEGVDRKLNVALTRARERVIVVGNEGLLNRNKIYSDFIGQCKNGIVAPNAT